MHSRRLIALIIVCAYLLIPLESFACLEPPCSRPLPGSTFLPAVSALEDSAPHCPCSDRHGRDGCDTSCSCCSCSTCIAPRPSGIVFHPTVTRLSLPEPPLRFPQVFLAIFVPPQNPISR